MSLKKLHYELDEQLESPSFTRISQQVMKVWRLTEENTEIFSEIEKLVRIVEEEQSKQDDLKSFMYLLAGKIR